MSLYYESLTFSTFRILLFMLLLLNIQFGSAFWLTQAAHLHRHLPSSSSSSFSSSSTTLCWEKPSWLDDAMEGFQPKEDLRKDNEVQLDSGIAGFAVDPEQGFLAILTTLPDEKWIEVLVSPIDRDRLQSPEALTCVQLAGGLDLATAVLPPDALAKLAMEDEDDDNQKRYDSSQISLAKITVIPNPNYSSKGKENKGSDDSGEGSSTPKRDAAIEKSLPKVQQAIKGLPGLNGVAQDRVLQGMQQFANSDGMLDRTDFSNLLEYLRAPPSSSIHGRVLFQLEVNIIGTQGIAQRTIETTNAMLALGVAMRHKITPVITNECHSICNGGIGSKELLERHPVFRPMRELYEDAKIMDGFIPTMFEKVQIDKRNKNNL